MSAWADNRTRAPQWRRALAKTLRRTAAYARAAAAMQEPERDQVAVIWLLGIGAVTLLAAGADATLATLAPACLLLATLLGICAIDSRYGIIPDSMSAALALGSSAQILAGVTVQDFAGRAGAALGVLLAGLAAHALYRRLRGYDGFGLGDVKLLAAACLWVGGAALSLVLVVAVLSACLSLAILRLRHRLSRQDAIPFGPHLAVGLWLVWVAGDTGLLDFLAP